MKRAGWPRAPLILGFILGRIMENSLHISMQAYGIGFITRPICLALLAAIVITMFYAVRSHLRMKRDTSTVDVTDAEAGEPRLSLGLAIGICAVLVYAIATAFAWPPIVRLFPLAFSIPALLLALFAIYFDWRAIRLAPAAAWSAANSVELTARSSSSAGSPASSSSRSCSASTSPCRPSSCSICWSGAATAGSSR